MKGLVWLKLSSIWPFLYISKYSMLKIIHIPSLFISIFYSYKMYTDGCVHEPTCQ